ncbi:MULTISPECIES: GntR family transcriptional regulator [unclassified Streptomyces]|uniref:GntR family transcriptional regulator n=1 Tax=unclassified Streptomyces TaxID=2593676 RepID=UPI0006FCC136|nr:MULTISPECIES: GntR family transcriptional regulator [unclassified Streptomyces]KQX58124.1 GntR family transcriptional regulator [Streptomyces sp. Root1304]KRA95452.1 GntR family transcriptional regulator [Streptomyces sp. Root66D1]
MPSLRDTIAADLRAQITTGHLKAGARLPSEPRLAAQYKVSTPTLRNALALLQAEGLIEKIHGKGNYVRGPLRRLTYTGGRLIPDTDLHVTIRTTTLRAHGDLIPLLKVPARTPLTEFLYLTHSGESPHSLTRIYVPRDPASAMPSWHLSAAEQSQDQISARLPTPEEASMLRISATLAVLSITRVSTDTTGRVMEAALLVLPSDRADALFTTHHTTEERGTEG